MRESQGVYQFGTRKIHIKLEHMKNLRVKVAGGFLSLDEFLDQYTAIELEKMDRVNTTYNKKLGDGTGKVP